ncbi:AsmA-like C-terminal region-containing protein [Oscillatoria amoena NRMC-F 0135]|nr:AsmA-like C-terminal region-containing protein [Oscillatoria amoena NRMC-F 0135]
MVKKIAIGLLIVVIVLVAAAFILPVIFKDDIKAAIDREIAKSVNADVVFDADKFSLTLFRNFPNITAEMRDFGIINREPFAGEVLFATEKLEVEVNLKDLLFGDKLKIRGISLFRPIINVRVLEDGRANYDIAIPSADTIATTEEPGEFSFGIDHWQVVEADIVYDDKSIPFFLELKNVNHKGSGDFTQASFDLRTSTVADTVNVGYAGDLYLANKRAQIGAVISISEEFSKYTFKENSAKINDFAMSFDGWLKLNDDNFDMDISFNSPENTFKSLLSLVPGMYSESFTNIQTDGELRFNGFVKGIYSEQQMPAFNVNLNVKDAMFKYPDLPTPVNNIQLDLLVDNKDGVIDNTVIDIKKFHMDFGSNPFDARVLISKLYPTQVDANLQAKLNLAEVSKMFPVEGLELKGNYAVNLTAKGVYDSLKKTIPSIDAAMSLANGYVKSAEFPLPLQDMGFNANVKNNSGKMAETTISVKNFAMVMDNEKFTADLLIQNLEDYTWDVKANGGVDLEKITKIFPLDGMTLAGKVKADLATKGKMSDLNAQRYDKLPTSGSASVNNFRYTSKDLPYAVTLAQAEMSFDPKKIEMKQVTGTIGKSDFTVAGAVSNYIGFLFGKNELLKGNMNFSSTLLDLNEFMTETGETPAPEETTSYGVIPVPENIDFVLKSSIRTVKMMDFTITNAAGDIVVRDGIANLSGLSFNLLGGSFTVNGAYNPKDMAHPKYDFALKIESLSLAQAATSFSIVKTYAPVAGLMSGNFSTDFKVSGELLQDMMPNLGTVNGDGLVKVVHAALKGSQLVSGITSLTKLDNTNEVTMKDVLMSASIKNGRLSVRPFDVKFGDYKTTVSGSTGVDGSIDYALKMDVPAGKLGTQFNSFVSQYTGGKTDPNAMIPVNIGLGGSFLNPQPKLLMTEQKQQVQQAVTTAVQQEAEKKASELVGGLLNKNQPKSDTAKKDSIAKPEDPKKKAVDDGVKTIQNLLKKKKN